MNKMNNKILRVPVVRLCAIVMMLVLGGVTVSAEDDFGINKLSINQESGLTVNPGQEATIQIELTNDAAISSLQFDLSLPKGLSYVSIKKDLTRMTKTSHEVMCVEKDVYGDDKVYRIGLLTMATDMKKSAIKGNSGTILELTVKAETNYKGGYIKFGAESYGGVVVVGENGEIDNKSVALDTENAYMSLHVGTVTLDRNEELALWPNGDTEKVSLMLQNDIQVTALQCDLKLPEGVTLLTDEDGEYVFDSEEAGRLSEHVSIMARQAADGTYRIVVSSLTSDVFTGNEGALFSFSVRTAGDFAGAGEVKVCNVKVSGVDGISYVIDGAPSFTVSPITDITGDGQWNIDDLQQWIDGAFIGKDTARKYDVNRDGKIEVDDLDAVVGLVMAPVQAGEGE